VARSTPQERLRELAGADPEEAGHFVVELASGLPGRRGGTTAPPCGRVVGEQAPDHRSGGREDRFEHRHDHMLRSLDQRPMFER
jgi:hypothetical protein